MIVTVFVPMTTKISDTDAFFLKSQKKEAEFLNKIEAKRTEAEEELNNYLNKGFTVLYADKIDDSGGTVFAYHLYKRDPEQFELTDAGRAALKLSLPGECQEQSAAK